MPRGNDTDHAAGLLVVSQTVPQTSERLRAYEPTPEELARVSPTLALFYNDEHNRAMMANTVAMTATDIEEHVAGQRYAGARPFLLERNGVLMGDADFRHITASTAEIAILIGRRSEQAKGLGTRFAVLLHALAFGCLGLERIFVSILPANVGSQRLFAKLGYQADSTPEARALADYPDDLTFSVTRSGFEAIHGAALPTITWSER